MSWDASCRMAPRRCHFVAMLLVCTTVAVAVPQSLQMARTSVPLASNRLHITYLVEANIGDPVQSLPLVFDTGSSNLGVAGSMCTSPACGTGATYSVVNSTTATPLTCKVPQDCHTRCPECDCVQMGADAARRRGIGSGVTKVCAFSTLYVDGTGWTAMLVEDDVSIGPSSVNSPSARTAVGVIFNSTVQLGAKRGTMGVALRSLSATGTTWWTSYTQQTGVDDLLGVCLAWNGGVLSLGGVDQALLAGEVRWTSMNTAESLYGAPLVNVEVVAGNMSVAIPVAPTDSGAVIDTGSSAIFMQAPAYQGIVDAVGTLCRRSGQQWVGVCDGEARGGNNLWNTSVCINATTSDLEQWPLLRFTFSPANSSMPAPTVDVPATAYMVPSQLTPPGHQPTEFCRSLLQSSLPSSNLGDPFLRSTYAVFGVTSSTIGFAPSVPGCGLS